MTDEELLRASEPVLRFARGELFFPLPRSATSSSATSGRGAPNGSRRSSSPTASSRPSGLAEVEAPPGERLFLRYVQKPLAGVRPARWRARGDRPAFEAPGRLARVGLLARLLDAAFTISLFLRGSVPGGTALAAAVKYDRLRELDPRNVYYGRVVRVDGWIVLQYLLFYVMNDWRTSFGGANDHEADWEQVFVYLEEGRAGPRPVWCAAASHESRGDDLRRRWDDPLLEKAGGRGVGPLSWRAVADPSREPLSEDEIRAVTVGEPERLAGPVAIAAYDPAWPQLFVREADRIWAALGAAALAVEHVGSTAVPGLAAKPRIDVLLVVADSAAENDYLPPLERAGYVLRIREPGWYEHRVLSRPDAAVNVHVFSPGCPEIERMLSFRDRLRRDASDRALYERTKRALAAREWQYVQNYADAKAAVVEEILARARAEKSDADGR